MGRICIEKAGITSLKSDAVVNAANEALQEGNGVCGEIFKEAGPRELQAACEAIGGCRTGNAVITPGFKLRSKYIIHAVGPQWIDGNHNESKQLYNAYKQSLILASQNGCKSIAFPLISSGNFGYPVNKAWEQALQSCLDFQKENPNSDLLIQFAVIDDKTLDAGKKMLAELNNEKTTLYLKELDSESLQKIRCRISKKWDLLLDKKAHPIAAGLMSVLCDQKVIDGLAVEQLIKMIESIFPEPVLHESWISQFGNLLLRVVNESKKKKVDMRASRYEKYMTDVMIPALNAGAHSGTVLDDIERLEDLYKIAVCLYRFHHGRENEFTFEVDIESMEKLNKAIQNAAVTGGNVLGIKIILGGAEDRQYAIFMSWVLEEMLGKHEGLREGENDAVGY